MAQSRQPGEAARAPGPPVGEAARSPGHLAVAVRGLHEVFRVYHERPPGLKERLYRLRRARYTRFHALDGIDLEVRQGETVGLIGHNGSGKSTLLKCIAGILPPDRGEVAVDGRVATLLELGAGFHEDLSGRENIFLNGAILGLSRKEVLAAFDEIVDFAGVHDFIDAPVRNYSSGMYVRLGFAIAVHVDPDILLIDEVLSVGDAAFQERSLARMRRFSERGKTVVLVSHDLGAVRSLCERTVVLHGGKVAFDGPTDEAVEAYQRLMTTGRLPERPAPGPAASALATAERSGDRRARITSVTVEVPGSGIVSRTAAEPVTVGPVPSGARTVVAVEITVNDELVADGGLAAGIHVRRPDVQPSVYEARTSWRVTYLAPPPVGASLRVTFDLEANLLTGSYLVDLLVGNAETGTVHDRWAAAVELQVDGPAHDMGIAPLRAEIAVHNPDGVWPAGSRPPPESEGGPRHDPRRDAGAPAGGSAAPAGGGDGAAEPARDTARDGLPLEPRSR